MDYIAPELSTGYIVTLSIIGAIGVALLLVVAIHIFRNKSGFDPYLVVPFGTFGAAFFAVSLALTLSGVESYAPALERQDSAVRAEIQDVYGLELTEGEMDRLKYPVFEPESDFEAFGSIEKVAKAGDEKLVERKLYLVWDTDSFGIFQSENGEDFLPLETQN